MSAAVHHILRQMQRDARLAWLIGPGSRTYELLTEEAAASNSLDLDELRQQHEATLKFEPWPTALDVEFDPRAVLLDPPKPTPGHWLGNGSAYVSQSRYMARHHADALAPYWLGYESRTAVLGGERWNSAFRFYVPDDFGTLVEVHQ